jgi:Arc/MetJ-type ribon-helix-helix transcriptional regulator
MIEEMDIDIDSLVKGVELFGSALTAIKQAIDLLPDNYKKVEAKAALERAEREFKILETIFWNCQNRCIISKLPRISEGKCRPL